MGPGLQGQGLFSPWRNRLAYEVLEKRRVMGFLETRAWLIRLSIAIGFS